MDKNEYLEKASKAILDADEEEAVKLAEAYLEEGLEPTEMIENGLSAGIMKLGELFDRGEVVLPHVIIASEAMTAAVKILEKGMPEEEKGKKKAKIVLGTVEGDVHDIGKGIVSTMLKVYGYEIFDLGRDVPIEEFVDKAKEVKADVVGSSALMTTTQAGQKILEKSLKEAGIRGNIKTMIGGAATTVHWAEKIGADFWAENASDTVMKLNEIFD